MSFIKILIGAAAIALATMSAQTYALTKILKHADFIEHRWPNASARETLENLDEHRRDPRAHLPFGDRDLRLPYSGDHPDVRGAL